MALVQHDDGRRRGSTRLVIADDASDEDVVLEGKRWRYSARENEWIGIRLDAARRASLPVDVLDRMLRIIVRALRVQETWVQLGAFGLRLRNIPEERITLPKKTEREKNRLVFRCNADDLSRVVELYAHYLIYETLFFVFEPSSRVHELAEEFFPEECRAFRADIRGFGRAFLYINTEVMHVWGLLPTSPAGRSAAVQLRELNDVLRHSS